MKQRFILFRRAGVYYSEDTTTRQQISLHPQTLPERRQWGFEQEGTEGTERRTLLSLFSPVEMQFGGKKHNLLGCRRSKTTRGFLFMVENEVHENSCSKQFCRIRANP